MALGSDIIGVALEGYGLLKVSGKDEGLKSARRELSARWAKTGRSTAEAPACLTCRLDPSHRAPSPV